jgi:cobalt-precorrin 5A hydrolase
MAGQQIMIAAGLGCRSGCSVDDVVQAISSALAGSSRGLHEVSALYTADFKSDAACLRLAAERLAIPLLLLSSAQLKQHAGGALTASPRVMALFELPSVSEAAALAGAASLANTGGRVRLLGARVASGGATCALASVEGLV